MHGRRNGGRLSTLCSGHGRSPTSHSPLAGAQRLGYYYTGSQSPHQSTFTRVIPVSPWCASTTGQVLYRSVFRELSQPATIPHSHRLLVLQLPEEMEASTTLRDKATFLVASNSSSVAYIVRQASKPLYRAIYYLQLYLKWHIAILLIFWLLPT